jgi:phospholipid/cholesterol/gamma-HCH transport system substrate-binding protein
MSGTSRRADRADRLRRAYRASDVVVGLGYLVLTAALVVGALAVYDQTYVDRVEVRLEVDALGNALQEGSDVKLRGVPVGRVSDVAATADGAELTLALDPETADDLPRGTLARLLPKTLFGERYVALVAGPDADDVALGLTDGDTIHQDASREAVALEDVLDELLPLLQAIQPEKLAATLGELATMLRGQGERIGDTMVAWSDYLEKLNPLVPQMTEDLALLADVAEVYDDAAPDLLDALDTLTGTSRTFAEERGSLRGTYARVIAAADTTTGWLQDNRQTIRILSEESREALRVVEPYARSFPCLFRAARQFIPVMDDTLGAGTDEPGVHVRLNIVGSRGKYVPGADTPSYDAAGEPRCPYVPSSRARAAAVDAEEPGAIPAPPSPLLQAAPEDAAGLGEANSPAENQLIAELVAPTQGLAPSAYPAWGSLLVGPVLRGAEVELR